MDDSGRQKNFKIGKPQEHIINPHLYEQYICNICFQLPLRPVRCVHCKKCLCTPCCIDQKVANDRCPFRCGGNLQLERALEVRYSFSCPYSSNCKKSIESIRQFYQHDKHCTSISKTEKEKAEMRWTYKCEQGHTLMLENSTYELLISRRKCSGCQEFCLCRSVCKKCDSLFCYDCKPFPMVKHRCLLGHPLLKRKVEESENYRCDICQLSPHMIGVQVYDDKKCNYGICEMCMESMIIFEQPQPVLEYDPTKCQKICLYNSSAPSAEKGHEHHLVKNFSLKEICDSCGKEKLCIKTCPKCQTNYCPACKPMMVSQNFTCEFGHLMEAKSFMMPTFCCNCTQILKPEAVSFYDRLCMLTFCDSCINAMIYINLCLEFRKGTPRIGNCKQGHQIYSLPQQQTANCAICKAKKNNILSCLLCQDNEKYFCCACLPPQPHQCYCGRQINQGSNVDKQCLLCNKKGLGCLDCFYSICTDCEKLQNKTFPLKMSQNN